MYFVLDDGPSEGPKHVAFLVQAVKGCCIQWQYNNNTNSHFLDILFMKARGSIRYDTRRTPTVTPSAYCYLFSALIISVKWGTRDGMKEIRNNEGQYMKLKGINAVNSLYYSLSA
jgi:hypothetical protein